MWAQLDAPGESPAPRAHHSFASSGPYLVLFGGTKIPQLAKGLGEGIREFKKSVIDEEKPEDKKSDGDGS